MCILPKNALLAETTCHVTCRGSTTACHLDGDEVDSRLICNGFGHKCLSTTWRAVKQHPCCRPQAHGCILLWVSDGLCDGKRQLFPYLQCNLRQYMHQVMISEVHVQNHKQSGGTSMSVSALQMYKLLAVAMYAPRTAYCLSSPSCPPLHISNRNSNRSIHSRCTRIVQEDKLFLCSSPQLESQHHSR